MRQAWAWIDPIINHWKADGMPSLYRAGTWGPDSADELLAENNHAWFNAGSEK